jgi:hypothetical protein
MLLVAFLVAGPSAVSRAQTPDEIPLEDVLEIVVLERQLLAIDAAGGGQTSVDLQIGEGVIWTGARGRVGVAITERRLLAVAARSAAWQEERWRRTESAPTGALLGDRVALVVTSERALGFNGGSGNLVEYRFGPHEEPVLSRTGANVAVVVTNRNAIGLSPQAGGFFPVDLQLAEEAVDLTARSNLATLRTSRRLLFFRGPSGTWESRRLDLGDR